MPATPAATAGGAATATEEPLTEAEKKKAAKAAAKLKKKLERTRPNRDAIARAFGGPTAAAAGAGAGAGAQEEDVEQPARPASRKVEPPKPAEAEADPAAAAVTKPDDDDAAEERENEQGEEEDDDPEQPRESRRVDPAYLEKLRVEKRRRAARGSPLWRYFAVRLQLRHMLSSPRSRVTLGVLALVALEAWVVLLWVMLTFGRPNAPATYWTNVESFWGGDLGNASSCEARDPDAFVRQRASGLATMAYPVVGVFILLLFALDAKHQASFEARFGNVPASIIVRQPGWSLLIGTSTVFLGVMTFLRHATNSWVAFRLETTAYWCVMFSLATCGLARLLDPPAKLRSADQETVSYVVSLLLILATFAVDVAFGVRLEVLQGSLAADLVFGALSAVITATTFVHWYLHRLSIETDMWFAPLAAALFGTGFALAHNDVSHLCGNPHAFWQAYANWHVFNAAAILCLYFLFRSDLWVKGDGAETTPKLRPAVVNFRRLARVAYETVQDTFLSKDRLKEVKKLRRKTRSGRRVTMKKNGQVVDDEGRRVAPSRLKTFKSLATIAKPEMGMTQKQIRIMEFCCGVGVLGVVVTVAVFALSPAGPFKPI